MIRVATSDDLAALLEIQASLSRPNPELLRVSIDGPGLVLVSAIDDRPVGYLLAFAGPSSTYVAELAVDPAHRREGHASGLLSELIVRSERAGHEHVGLAVRPTNDPARRLYESLGFEAVERRPEYYDDGPAIVMRRDL